MDLVKWITEIASQGMAVGCWCLSCGVATAVAAGSTGCGGELRG